MYRRLIRDPLWAVGHAVLAGPFLVIAATVALERRRRRIESPRVIFGITPIINIKYWSRALRSRGYEAYSCVYDVYSINRASDFDYMPSTLFPGLARIPPLFGLLSGYLCSLWAMREFDVYVLDFEGGFLRHTPLRRLEFPLLRLAGVRVIAIPYGGDVVVLDRVRDGLLRSAFIQDYPGTADRAPEIRRWVKHYARWASLIVCGGMLVDFVPRFDVAIPSPIAIDIDEWNANLDAGQSTETNPETTPRSTEQQPVRVLHAPNHRHLKGTAFLEEACAELQAEGTQIELIICERVPNQEIRARMRDCDIVVSALVMGYYELFAIEGMSMGKTVVNYWRPDLKAMYSAYSFAGECPVVDASPTTVKEALRALIEDPDRRRRLGAAGREYVERHHSYAAVGEFLEGLLERVGIRTRADS
jgi:hypothetical protein